jgi:hypothetical protein
MMKIIEFYTRFVKSLGCSPKVDDDRLYYPDGAPVMFTYLKKERHLTLPTNRIIQLGLEVDGHEVHTFHPLCESMLTGESGTIRFLKAAIRMRLWQTATDLVTHIIKQGAENKPVKRSTYKKFLAKLCDGIKEPKFDDRLVESWAAVLEYLNDPEKMAMADRLRLVITAHSHIGTEKFARVARYLSFASQEGEDDTANYLGVRCRRKQDKVIIHRLLSTVFGWYPEEVGSNDNRANFAALARGWANYVSHYNAVAGALHDIYGDVEVLEDGWILEMENLDNFDKVVQTLPYNTGPNKDGDNTSAEYSVKTKDVLDLVAPNRATTIDAAPEGGLEDPLALFAARRPKALSGMMGSAIDPKDLTPAQQAEWESSRRISQKGTIRDTSLASALNQRLPEVTPSLTGGNLGGMTLSSLMGGQSSLGGGLGQQQLGQRSLGAGNAPLGGGFTW